MSSSSSFEEGESSRTESSHTHDHDRERERELPESEPRPWVALSAIPVVVGADDDRASTLVPGGGSDLLLDLHPPLSAASYMLLPDHIVPDRRRSTFPYVVAACSDRLLFMASTGDRDRKFAYFLGDAYTRTAARLPDVPSDLRDLGLELDLRRSVGIIADPRHDGHYTVAQLHPTSASATRHHTLLRYCTFTDEWTATPLASSPDHEPWGAHGVLAHGGLLWWIDIAYGMLGCDPFAAAADLHLRLVPLPFDSQMHGLGDGPRPSALPMNQRRFIRTSQGKIRFVEILEVPVGPAAANAGQSTEPVVRMFALVGDDHWVLDYTARFADIWGDRTYAEAGLPRDAVPSLALVDPNNSSVLFFLQEKVLFAVDAPGTQVLHRMEYVVDSAHQRPKFQNSCFIHAWELPPGLLPDEDATSVGSGAGDGDDSDSDEDEELLLPDRQRDELEEEINCVQDKINVERDFRRLEKLFRERAYLKRVMEGLNELR